MESVATWIEFFTLAFFLCVTLLPAIGTWNAVTKVFVYPTVIFSVWLLTCMYTALTFKQFKPCRRPFQQRDLSDVRHCSNTVGMVTIIVWVFLGVLYFASLMNMANPMSIHLPTLESPCGVSSCVNRQNVDAVVNPNGFFTDSEMPYSAGQAITCVFDDCFFADGTTQGVLGYPPRAGTSEPDTSQAPCAPEIACLATYRPQDYPNPGIGLANGYFAGLNDTNTNTAICQGNVMLAGVNRGRRPCPYCLAYWRANYGYNPASLAHCADAENAINAWAVCSRGWYCPDYDSVRTRASTVYQFLCSVALTCLPLIRWGIYEAVGSICERRRRRLANPARSQPKDDS